jgi:DNA-directed RNA polymerase specialized sigma24 family protein
VQTSEVNNIIGALQGTNSQVIMTDLNRSQNKKQLIPLQETIENLIDGILILTDQKELIYANKSARQFLDQLNQNKSVENLVPKEVWYICQSLIQSRRLFPNQHWLIESEIFTDSTTALHIRARWLRLDMVEHPCLLLTVEDRYQASRDIELEKAEHYGLTSREKQVWLLHRANYTYKEIASKLGITPNTVKKHMRSIHAKQKTTSI